jgi:trans-aconitate 2-methyltransferase
VTVGGAREDAWSPEQYARFRDERSRPFFDLMGLVRAKPGMRVVDLGCGPGELTVELHRHLEAVETVGLDNSDAMLAKAAAHAGDGLRFEKGDIDRFGPGGAYDLVFSNAALNWVEDHPTLLGRLTAALAPDGQLAVQVPANDDHPSHATIAEVAEEAPFREALGGFVRRSPVLPPERYAELLDASGYREQDVRMQVYAHRLESRDAVVEWVKGSWMTEYERRLPPELYERFVERYRELLVPRLADTKPFFYTFKRILFWGRR